MISGIGAGNRYIIPASNVSYVAPVNTDNTVFSSGKAAPAECQACKNRRHQDGSDEMVCFR